MFRRQMGMRLGGAAVIDDVEPQDFALLADDLGIGRRAMARICAEMASAAPDALMDAGECFERVSETALFDAEDLVEEITPRLSVIRTAGGRP